MRSRPQAITQRLPLPPLDDLDLRLETTTFMLNLEKQGLEDNTFTNGLGRDTTLIGNLVNVYKRLLPSLEPDSVCSPTCRSAMTRKSPKSGRFLRLTYQPTEQVTAVIGTLAGATSGFPRCRVTTTATASCGRSSRGLKSSGFESIYRQDLFINWEQAFVARRPIDIDVGYAGQLRFGSLRFNGQAHWVHNGQALFKLDRSFNTRDNLVVAAGPGIRPGTISICSGRSPGGISSGIRYHLSDKLQPSRPMVRPSRARL